MQANRVARGDRYGRLVVISDPEKPTVSSNVRCRCDCGRETSVRVRRLLAGETKSCGCLRRKHGATYQNRTPGKATPEYTAWLSMRRRCGDPKVWNYSEYGGRGIRVCQQWQESFERFLSDMGPRPSSEHSLDRIDPNGNYEPGNCRWATPTEQQNNLRTNRLVEFRGRTQTLSMWARELAIPRSTLETRLCRGSSVEDAFTLPRQPGRRPRRAADTELRDAA